MVRILSHLILLFLFNWSVLSLATVRIGAEAFLPVDPRQENSRFLGFRPADGQEVTLNPPRISWPYLPGILLKQSSVPATQKFTLQIAADSGFSNPVVEIADTPYNFYNFLPPLEGQQTWYWRVGYNLGSNKAEWSAIRKFDIAKDATPWDRSNFESLIDGISGHPRILFNKNNFAEFRALQENNALSKAFAKEIIRAADSELKSKFYRNFPKNDDASMSYMPLSSGLVHIGFAYLLTGDKKYLGFKERTLTMASPGKPIAEKDLSPRLRGNETSRLKTTGGSLRDRMDGFERNLILNVLDESDGNASRTAQKLGISRAGLYKKLDKHGIRKS